MKKINDDFSGISWSCGGWTCVNENGVSRSLATVDDAVLWKRNKAKTLESALAKEAKEAKKAKEAKEAKKAKKAKKAEEAEEAEEVK